MIIAFIFSWDNSKSQDKMEAVLMQGFGGTKKKYYGIFESGLCSSTKTRRTEALLENIKKIYFDQQVNEQRFPLLVGELEHSGS